MTITYGYTTNHSLQPLLDLVQVQVSGTYDAAATAITLESGEGAKLPAFSTLGPQVGIYWDAGNNATPYNDPQSEAVLVTAKAGDILTVTRGWGNTSATTKQVTVDANYVISFGWHAGILADIAACLPYNPQATRWGAAFDGVTDDTAAILACMTAAAAEGRPVFLPPGTALVAEIAVPAALSAIYGVWGASILKQKTLGQNILYFDRTSGCKIEGVKFQGISGTSAAADNNGILIDSEAATPAIGDNAAVIIRNCWFRQCRLNGIEARWIRGLEVSGCFLDTVCDGVKVLHGQDVQILGSRWNASQVPENSASDCMAIEIGTETSTPGASDHCERVTISRNQIEGRTNSVGVIRVRDAAALTIAENILDDVLIGIRLDPTAAGSQAISSVRILGNTIRVSTTSTSPATANQAIYIVGESGNAIGPVSIKGNELSNGNFAQDNSGQAAVHLLWTTGSVVQGNAILTPKRTGILIAGTHTDLVIVANTIVGVAGTAGDGNCVEIDTGAVVDGFCGGNNFADSNRGVYAIGTGSGFHMGRNQYTGLTTPVALGGGSLNRYRMVVNASYLDPPGTLSGTAYDLPIYDEGGTLLGYIGIIAP